jgi:hypothetical protein
MVKNMLLTLKIVNSQFPILNYFVPLRHDKNAFEISLAYW